MLVSSFRVAILPLQERSQRALFKAMYTAKPLAQPTLSLILTLALHFNLPQKGVVESWVFSSMLSGRGYEENARRRCLKSTFVFDGSALGRFYLKYISYIDTLLNSSCYTPQLRTPGRWEATRQRIAPTQSNFRNTQNAVTFLLDRYRESGQTPLAFSSAQ